MVAAHAVVTSELPRAALPRDVDALGSRSFDVAVVGGGMHGAWIAWRAAAAGYRTALVERGEFGGGTSANSLRILHGGLRYLQHLDFRRMRASIRARRELMRLAPTLVRPLPCVMPLERIGLKSPWVMGPALAVNDLVACDRNSGVAGAVCLPRGRLVGARRCRALVAPLAAIEPSAGALWYDALALDTAALTLAPLRAAVESGAVAVNRAEARGLRVRGGAVHGVVVRDADSGADVDVSARVVVDASGPWAGRLAARAGLPTPYLPRAWIGALNLVLSRSLGIDVAVALPSVTRNAEAAAVSRARRRELFFVPWQGVTMVGTDYRLLEPASAGLAPEDAAPTSADVAAFVDEVAQVAPRAGVREADVAALHWGILPADERGAAPRRSAIVAGGAARTGAAGLVVAIGEKLTSAPVVASRVLRAVASASAEAGRKSRKRR